MKITVNWNEAAILKLVNEFGIRLERVYGCEGEHVEKRLEYIMDVIVHNIEQWGLYVAHFLNFNGRLAEIVFSDL